MQSGACVPELVEQGSLGGGRHAVGADQGWTLCAQPVGDDGQHVGVFADVHGPVRHLPGRWVAQQLAQRQVEGLAGGCSRQGSRAGRQVQAQGRASQFIDQHAGSGPDVALAFFDGGAFRQGVGIRQGVIRRCGRIGGRKPR